MANDAHIILNGRLIADPKNNTVNDSSVTSFIVAVNTTKKADPNSPNYNKQYPYENDLYNVSMWGKQADYLMTALQKGTIVEVIGELTLRTWTDRNNNEQKQLAVTAQYVKVLTGKKNSNDSQKDQDTPF